MPLLLQKNDKDELPLLPLLLEVDDNMLLLQEEERPLLPGEDYELPLLSVEDDDPRLLQEDYLRPLPHPPTTTST